jgi:hypothetical protein
MTLLHKVGTLVEDARPPANRLAKLPSSTICKYFEKCPDTSNKSHAHLQCVHNNCARLEECQPKGVKGVDYTK